MTLFLDSTAVLARFTDDASAEVVHTALRSDPTWCVSAVALTECRMLAQRLDTDDVEIRRLQAAVLSDWAMFNVVPVDALCIDRAAVIGREQPVRTIDAIHLAAADRLPRPVTFITFDPNQIGPALGLGMQVTSTLVDDHQW